MSEKPKPSKKDYPFDLSKKPPIVEWIDKNNLADYHPTSDLRMNGEVLEQKWAVSKFEYNVRWIPIRKKRRDEK